MTHKTKRTVVAVFGLASQLSADSFYARPPRIGTWSNRLDLAATTANTQATAFFAPATPITITRFSGFATTVGVTCSSAPVLTIRDLTTSTSIASGSITFSNGIASADTGAIATAVPAGDLLTVAWTQAAGTCGTTPVGVTFNVQYK